jgi:hypothetical protein
MTPLLGVSSVLANDAWAAPSPMRDVAHFLQNWEYSFTMYISLRTNRATSFIAETINRIDQGRFDRLEDHRP